MAEEVLEILTDSKEFLEGIHLVETKTQQTLINLNDYGVLYENSSWYLTKEGDKKYLLTLNALDQICKVAKVPTAFLVKNPESLSNSIMEYWFPPEVDIEPSAVRYFDMDGTPVPVARGFLPQNEAQDVMGLETFWNTLKKQLSEKSGAIPDLICAEGYNLSDGALMVRFKFIEDPLEIYPGDSSLTVLPTLTVAYSDCGGLRNFIIETGYMSHKLPLHANLVFRPDRKPYFTAKSKGFTRDELDRVLKFNLDDSLKYIWNPSGKNRVTNFLKSLDNILVTSADFNYEGEKLPWIEKMLDFKGFPPAVIKNFQNKVKENSVEVTSLLSAYFGMLDVLAGLDMSLVKRAAAEAAITSFFYTSLER